MTSTNTATSALPASLTNASATTSSKVNEASDRFLKLLVTQMQNQDPLNPMDNAQVTSQMAQINTVTGIEKLNSTVSTLNGSFAQMQVLQSVNLVGHSVLLEGNKLSVTDGVARGGYEIASQASDVTVEVMGPGGDVIDTIDLNAKAAGQHDFEWTVPSGLVSSSLTFKVTAKSGNATLPSTPLMTDQVNAVSSKDGTLTLELRKTGDTAYDKVKAIS